MAKKKGKTLPTVGVVGSGSFATAIVKMLLERAHRNRGLQIAQAVAHNRHIGQLDIEALGDLQQQSRLGFAAIAGGIGRVRAEKDGVEPATDLGEAAHHLVVDGVERIHAEQPAPHARLVGRDHHPPAPLVEAGNGLERRGSASTPRAT